MRILLIHNHYKSASPSGEDIAFENEKELLESNGHEVITYNRFNDTIGTGLIKSSQAALSLFWSRQSYSDLDKLIKNNRPDIAHFHNTFPLISSSGYSACRSIGVPVVQTLHNYRLICPSALLLRDGKPCEKCINGSLLNSVRYGCYRNSKPASALVAGMLAINRTRKVYTNSVDHYICLTEFAKQRFIRGGLPEEKLTVRANALMNPPEIGKGNGNYALFVGRLSQEKGVSTLIKSWESIKILPLKIVGEGPLFASLKQQASENNTRVEFLGFKTRKDVFELMRNATMLIIPSECYEGFPVTAMEGMACGTPMIVSAIGALDEILEAPRQCLKFQAGNAESLNENTLNLLNKPELREQMRAENRKSFEALYSPKQALSSLLNIYENTLAGIK